MLLKLLISIAILHPIICLANVAPKNYELSFDFTETAETHRFSGVVKIDFECLEQSSKFLLDCKDLEIVSYEISGDVKVENVTVGENDKCEILLEEDLVKGNSYLLTLNFKGKVDGSEPIGIFEAYYKDNRTTNHFISTNFEYGNAKRAFPCFDDPQYKTKFKIQIKHARDYSIIGSTTANSEEVEAHMLTRFEETPIPLNVGIISFSLYQNLKKTSIPLVSVAIHHPPERDVSTFLTSLITLRTAYSVLLGKSSISNHNYLAVPFSFEGRFDNWGSHVVDETNFLRPLLTSTPMKYQEMLQMYSHQFALNWVEFEVTPGSFDEWWISRGLAKFYEYYVISNTPLLNQFLSWKQFVTEITQKALENELNGDPIHGVKFNERSAAIFNMIQGVMGLENFNQGIKSLIKEFSGKTITTEDLFNELTKHVNDPLPAELKNIFMDWFKINGYPIVKVTRGATTVTLTQFLFTNTEDDRSLYIPINYVSGTVDEELDFEDTSIVDWLLPNTELTLEDIPVDNFVIFNKQQASFYRVQYDEPSLELILDLLLTNSSKVHPVTAAQLIDDYGSLARNGYVEFSDFFRLVEYLKDSKDSQYTEWSAAHKQLKFLWHRLRGSPAYDRFETFVRQLTEKRFGNIGLGTDLEWGASEIAELMHHQRLNRQFVADLACSAGVVACVNETMEYMENLMDGNVTAIFPELVETMACTTFKYDYEILDRLLEYIKKPSNESVERKGNNLLDKVNLRREFFDIIVGAIGCSRNESSLQTTLDLSIIPKKTIEFEIKASTRRKLFETVVKGNNMGTTLALKFMKQHYLAMNQRYDDMSLVFEALNGYILTDELLDMYTEVYHIYEAKFYPDSVRTAANHTLYASKADVEWTNTFVASIEAWLTENDYNGTTTAKPDDNAGNIVSQNWSFAIVLLMFLLFVSK